MGSEEISRRAFTNSHSIQGFGKSKDIGSQHQHQRKDLPGCKLRNQAPKIIVPENPQEENSRRLIVDLGNLAFYSDMKEVDEEKEENFYDRFVVNLTSIQLLLASGKVETTTQLLSDAEKSMQLVDKFDFNVTIYLRNRENIVLTQVK